MRATCGRGRADGFFTDQIKFTLFAFPLVVAGLAELLPSTRFRLLSLVYLGPLVLLAIARGRGYYLLPGYMILYAAGAVWLARLMDGRTRWTRNVIAGLVVCGLLTDVAAVAWAVLPIWKVGSPACVKGGVKLYQCGGVKVGQ